MNVIRRKTIMDKIENELSHDIDTILRIELKIEEFKKMCRELACNYYMKHISHVCINKCDIKFASLMCVLDDCYLLTPEELSGSYVVYKGVCIQTHVDYNNK